MDQGKRAVNEAARASKQMTDTMRELMQELAKLAMRCSSKERDQQVKAVVNACLKEEKMTFVEMDADLYRKFKISMEKEGLPHIPFGFKKQEDQRTNRDNIMLVMVRPDDLEKAVINLRTIEEMKRLECRKDIALFMRNNLYENMTRIPVPSDPAWEQRFHENATALNLEYSIKTNEKGDRELFIGAVNKNKASKALFMTEWDLKSQSADLVRRIALHKVETERNEKDRIGQINEKGAVYICSVNRLGERLLLEADRFVHYDKNGMEVSSMSRDESPDVYEYKRRSILDTFMRQRHVLIDALKLDEIIKEDPKSQSDYLLRVNSDNVINDVNITISKALKEQNVDSTKEERETLREDMDLKKAAADAITFSGLTITAGDKEEALGAISAALAKMKEAYVQAREEALEAGDSSMMARLDEKYIMPHSRTIEHIQTAMQTMDINEDFEVTKSSIIQYAPEEIEEAERKAAERFEARSQEMEKEQPEMEYNEADIEYEEFDFEPDPDIGDAEPEVGDE